MFDIVLRGGRVVDGTGNPWWRADVAITGDRIAAMGRLEQVEARQVVAVCDMVVCPGFIDVHNHSEVVLLAEPEHHAKVRQGVTTELLAPDGLGVAPATPTSLAALRRLLAGWNGEPEIGWDWESVAEFLARFDRQVAVNVAYMAPHGTVRLAVMGMASRPATTAELWAMTALVERCMRDGALGLSAGLSYAPAAFATTEELVALCRAVAPFGGFYCAHMRNHGAAIGPALEETIAIARQAGVPAHVNHLTVSYHVNRGRAPALLTLIDRARDAGLDVSMDVYPYLAGQTHLLGLFPSWAQVGEPAEIRERLADLSLRERMRHELEEIGCDGLHGVPADWEALVIAGMRQTANEELVGMSLAEAARRRRRRPFDLACELLLDEDLAIGIILHIGDEENIRAVLRHPCSMIGSDGLLSGTRPHPRGYGTFPRLLGRYVRELGVLRLEECVRKMTSLPAQRLGLRDRGILRPGMAADLVVFDPQTIQDLADFEEPRRYPTGIPYVMVNGEWVIAEGTHTGARPGRALRTM
jgi:N-acyl-D-amino-acid deacylase